MEGIQKAYRSAMSQAQESTAKLSSLASSLEKAKSIDSASSSSSSGMGSSTDQSRLLLATRPPRQFVTLWTCSKLCGICFIAGIVVGYTLKRRVRRWASRLLRRLKDD